MYIYIYIYIFLWAYASAADPWRLVVDDALHRFICSLKSTNDDSAMLFCASGCPLINQLLCQQPGDWLAGIPRISWNSMVPNEVPNEVRLGHVGDVILPFWLPLN